MKLVNYKLIHVPPCGNTECSMSMGIMGEATFGSGDLSDNGYWQIPCARCEEAWLEKHGTLQLED